MYVFISCGKKKRSHICYAKDLYIGRFLKAQKKYALNLANNDESRVFILSAKYGLLRMRDVISPYNLKLTDLKKSQRDKWCALVENQIKKKQNLDVTRMACILCGKAYRAPIVKVFKDCKVFGEGLLMAEKEKFFLES